MTKVLPTLKPGPRPSNPSALELAIHRYEVECAKFHNKRYACLPQDSKKAEAWIDQAIRDWQHLKVMRRQIVGHVTQQQSLAAYRAAAKNKMIEELYVEEHHPTERLAKHLSAAGEPKPTPEHEAHHIIPGKGRYRQDEIMNVRLNLHAYGIGINDPLNGAWLTNYKKNKEQNWESPNSPGHREIHRYNYETWIISRFMLDTLPEAVFINRLMDVKRRLRTGSHPANIMAKKNTIWSGEA